LFIYQEVPGEKVIGRLLCEKKLGDSKGGSRTFLVQLTGLGPPGGREGGRA